MRLLGFLSILLLITNGISAPYPRNRKEFLHSIQQCQNGRVCMNSCYSNGQYTNCNKSNLLKSVVFDPPFVQNPPSIHLRLVRLDFYDDVVNEDVKIEKENLTQSGMNIRFNLISKSFAEIYCVDWHACSEI